MRTELSANVKILLPICSLHVLDYQGYSAFCRSPCPTLFLWTSLVLRPSGQRLTKLTIKMHIVLRSAVRSCLSSRASRPAAIRTAIANFSKFDDREKAQEQQYVYAKEKELINKLKDLLSKREKELHEMKGDKSKSGASDAENSNDNGTNQPNKG